MSEVIVKSVQDMTAKEYAQCRSLNMRSKGMMRRTLVWLRTGKRTVQGWETLYDDTVSNGVAFMLMEDDVLLGWVLGFTSGLHINDQTRHAHFYIRHQARRRGYGKTLYNAVMKDYPGSTTHPWDTRSRRFFRKMQDG